MPLLQKGLSKPALKAYAIDDSQFLMCFAAFDRALETGYQKFTQFALDFYSLVKFVIEQTPPDVIVYFLHPHRNRATTARSKQRQSEKCLTASLTVEGLFSIVLLCDSDGNTHKFITQSDGMTTAKSPMEMFPTEIDNDLKAVDTAIREYGT